MSKLPIDDLARVCFASLMLMTLANYIYVKYDLAIKLKKYIVINSLIIVFNISISLAAAWYLITDFYIGTIFALLSIFLWIVNSYEEHARWLRPIIMNGFLFLVALFLLKWLNNLSFLQKIKLIY